MIDQIKNIPELLSEFTIQVEEGNINSLDAYIAVKEIEKIISGDKSSVGILEQLRDLAIDEAEKVKGESYKGYKVELKQGGRYDYSHISKISDLKQEMKPLEQSIKELQKVAQTAFKIGHTMVDDETGEVIEPAKYIPYATSIVLTKEKGQQ